MHDKYDSERYALTEEQFNEMTPEIRQWYYRPVVTNKMIEDMQAARNEFIPNSTLFEELETPSNLSDNDLFIKIESHTDDCECGYCTEFDRRYI